MIAAALEQNGAEKVYIVGRRKEVLENAAKTNNVCCTNQDLPLVV